MRKVLLGIALSFLLAAPAWAQLSIKFDKYHSYDEMVACLKEAAQKYPNLTRLSSIGKSYEGRDLWLIEITNHKTGPAEEKSAVYVNGGLDATEVVTNEGVLSTVQRLLEGYGADPVITEVLDKRAFYILPRVMPDAAERYLDPARDAGSDSAEPWDDDLDGKKDEDGEEDINADGVIVRMRVKDPHGAWKVSDRDPRLMVARRAGETDGVFYRVLGEGTDNDGDGAFNEDGFGGIDQNRNYPGNWRPNYVQRGSGPYPMRVKEVQAEVEFIYAHPNIAAYMNHHSSGGVVLRSSTTHSDATLPPKDVKLIREIAAMALDATGYWLATSVYDWRYPSGTPDTKASQTWRKPDGTLANDPRGGEDSEEGASAALLAPARPAVADAEVDAEALAASDSRDGYEAWGGTLEYTYELLGIVSYASEQWRCAFDNDLNKDGKISALEQLNWNDKNFGGKLFVNWTPFKHSQLGDVEIGGWKRMTTSSPPPGKYLEDENGRNFRFNLLLGRLLPEVKIREATATSLGEGVFKIVAKVVNVGFIPTATEMAKKIGFPARPVTATLQTDKSVEILSGDSVIRLGHLDGLTAQPVTAEWTVRVRSAATATKGKPAPVTPTTVTIAVASINGGKDSATVTIK